MPYEIEITVFDEYIRIDATGEIHELDEAIEFGHEIVAHGVRNDRQKYLIILQNIQLHLDYHDKTLMVDDMESENHHLKGYRSANVYSAENRQERHYETIGGARGHSSGAFTDEEEALEWLLR